MNRGRRLISGDTTTSPQSSARPRSILNADLSVPKGSVNRDAYLVLFAELVGYCQTRVQSVAALEAKLSDLGRHIGARAPDLIAARQRDARREVRLVHVLNFVVVSVWGFLFDKHADSLKKVSDSENEYYIEEATPMVNAYVSVPRDYGDLNCAAFSAGIIQGVLDAAGFEAEVAAKVIARPAVKTGAAPAVALTQPLTIYFMKFSDEVIAREKRLPKML